MQRLHGVGHGLRHGRRGGEQVDQVACAQMDEVDADIGAHLVGYVRRAVRGRTGLGRRLAERQLEVRVEDERRDLQLHQLFQEHPEAEALARAGTAEDARVRVLLHAPGVEEEGHRRLLAHFAIFQSGAEVLVARVHAGVEALRGLDHTQDHGAAGFAPHQQVLHLAEGRLPHLGAGFDRHGHVFEQAKPGHVQVVLADVVPRRGLQGAIDVGRNEATGRVQGEEAVEGLRLHHHAHRPLQVGIFHDQVLALAELAALGDHPDLLLGGLPHDLHDRRHRLPPPFFRRLWRRAWRPGASRRPRGRCGRPPGSPARDLSAAPPGRPCRSRWGCRAPWAASG